MPFGVIDESTCRANDQASRVEGKWKVGCACGQGCRRSERRARVGGGESDAGRTRGSP